MRYYFVRHAESAHASVGRYQSHHVDLSEIGKKQAHLLAKRFIDIPVDIILSSPYPRVLQTAQEVQKVVKKDLIICDLLKEWKEPTDIAGKLYEDPEALKIKEILRKNRADPNWHYSDEENIADLLKRAGEFLEYLKQFKQEHIVIASHNAVIKAILCMMVFGSNITTEMFKSFDESFEMSNTGITECEKDKGISWKVIAWNDKIHLN